MNDKTYTVTLTQIEWTHILAACSHFHRTYEPMSRLVRAKYGEIGRKIRAQIEEQPTKGEHE